MTTRSLASPKKAKPPSPATVRGLWIVALLIIVGAIVALRVLRPDVLAWAAIAQYAMVEMEMEGVEPFPDMVQRIPASLAIAFFQPDVQEGINLALAAVLGLIGLEALARLAVLTKAIWAPMHRVTLYRRIRTLHPNNRNKSTRVGVSEQLRALANALRSQGGGQEIALTMTRTPNEPATIGVQLHGQPEAARRTAGSVRRESSRERRSVAAWVQSLPAQVRALPRLLKRERMPNARAAIPLGTIQIFRDAKMERLPGHRPLNPVIFPDAEREAREPALRGIPALLRALSSALKRFDETLLIDAQDDPLLQAIRNGGTLIVREYRLERGPEWPLALADAIESDVMRSLAQALSVPTGVAAQELQICIAPIKTSALDGWYRRAGWLISAFRASNERATTDDYKDIQAKRTDTHLAVTLRLVIVVAPDGDLDVARTSLDVVESALRAIDAQRPRPSGMLVMQRFVATAGLSSGVYRLPEHPERPTLPQRLVQATTLGSVLLIVATLAAGASWWAGMWRVWGDLPSALQRIALAVAAVQGVLGVSATVWASNALRPWQALLRIGRPTEPNAAFLLDLFTPGVRLAPPAILSCSEAAHLWHLPDDLATTEFAWLPNRMLPAPESVFVPANPKEKWITFGRAYDSGGKLRPVGVPLRALHQMLHFTAGMGTGKSQAAAAMCYQLLPHGFILLDGKGDDESGSLVGIVRDMIPPEEEHRLRVMSVMDTPFPLALNPIYDLMVAMDAATSKQERDKYFNEALGLLLGLFQRLDPSRWRDSPGMQQYAQMACHLVLQTGSSRPGEIPTLLKVRRVLEDEAYRNQLLARYPKPGDEVDTFWRVREPELSDSQRTSLSALLRRLDLVFMNPITRNMLSVEVPSIDFLEAMEKGLIVTIAMPHRQLGELAPLIGMLVIQSIVSAAYRRPGDALSRITAPILIDEVQVFIVDDDSPDLEQAFTQLRGFGVPLIVMHQYLTQLGKLLDTFKVNAGNRIILRTNEPDASVYARMYAQSGLKAEDILGMHALNHQYAATLGPNREQLIFSIVPSPWPERTDQRLPPALVPMDWQRRSPIADAELSNARRRKQRALDERIVKYIYTPLSPQVHKYLTDQFAQLPDAQWEAFLQRWEEVRKFHYAYLLQHPNVIPDPLERQTWLSRLIGSRGGVIEEVIILRGQIKQGGVILPAKEPDQKQGEAGSDDQLNPDGTLNATTLPSPEPDDAEGREPTPRFADTPDDYLKTAGSFGMRNTRVLNALTPNDDDAADKEES
jgi:hypothetical protein